MDLQYVQSQNSTVSGKKFDVVCRALSEIEKTQGAITAHAVLAVAKNPKSPLHGLFEWDNTQAAEKYRLFQARMIIRSVSIHIVEQPDVEPVRAYISVAPLEDEERFSGRSYRSTIRVLQEPGYREQILNKARADLVAWKLRYEHLHEFASVLVEIEKVTSTKKIK